MSSSLYLGLVLFYLMTIAPCANGSAPRGDVYGSPVEYRRIDRVWHAAQAKRFGQYEVSLGRGAGRLAPGTTMDQLRNTLRESALPGSLAVRVEPLHDRLPTFCRVRFRADVDPRRCPPLLSVDTDSVVAVVPDDSMDGKPTQRVG